MYSASYRRPGKWRGRQPNITVSEAKGWATGSRCTAYREALVGATRYVKEVAGGESRRVRRSMARERARRAVRGVVSGG